MTGKIGYFLFALLVLTTGTLCRQQLPVQYASGGDSVGSLTQHVPPQEKSGLHYFHHSFIASETVSEVIAPMLLLSGLRKKVRSLAAIVRRIPIPTRWITTSFRWAKSGFDRFDCPHAHLPTEEAHHSCLTEFARKKQLFTVYVFRTTNGRNPDRHRTGGDRSGSGPRDLAPFVQPAERRGVRVRHSHARQVVDAVQSRVLPLCDPVPDVRRRNGIPLRVGRRGAGDRRLRPCQRPVLPVDTYVWPGLRLEWK